MGIRRHGSIDPHNLTCKALISWIVQRFGQPEVNPLSGSTLCNGLAAEKKTPILQSSLSFLFIHHLSVWKCVFVAIELFVTIIFSWICVEVLDSYIWKLCNAFGYEKCYLDLPSCLPIDLLVEIVSTSLPLFFTGESLFRLLPTDGGCSNSLSLLLGIIRFMGSLFVSFGTSAYFEVEDMTNFVASSERL